MQKSIVTLDIQMAELKKDITYIKETILTSNTLNTKEHTELFNLIREEFKNHFEYCEQHYAKKYIEKLAIIIFTIICTAIATYFLTS